VDVAVRRRAIGRGHAADEDALDETRQATEPLNLDGRAAVSSGGAVLTDRGIADVQRVAGNQATRSLIEGQTVQRDSDEGGTAIPLDQGQAPPPEESFDGSVESNFGENKNLYHTINNFSDQPLKYLLRIHNTGYALLSLETQYEYRGGEPQRAWTALFTQRGQTEEVVNGLPAHSVLHLRLFGERDYTQPDQSYYAGTLQVRRVK
jgi:hypothetical protein